MNKQLQGKPFTTHPLYEVVDGDYNQDDTTDLARFATDLLGRQFLYCVEICLSLEDDKIRIESTTTGEEWNDWNDTEYIPKGWLLSDVRSLFEGNVYFCPVGEQDD